MFTDAINALMAKPIAERTRADSLKYALLVRGVVTIDIYHSLLNCGPYDIVELIISAITDVVNTCNEAMHIAMEGADAVLAAIRHFFLAVGVTLNNSDLPWGDMAAGGLAGGGVAGVAIGLGLAVPGPGWFVAGAAAVGMALGLGVHQARRTIADVNIVVNPLEGPVGPLPSPFPLTGQRR